MADKQKKILITRLSALGDVAMTLPVIYSACRQYPDSQFFLLTRPFFGKIFINKPSNLTIIEADLKGRHKGVKGLMSLIKELKGYGLTHVADFHNVMRSWVIDAAMLAMGKKVKMLDKKRASRRKANRTRQQQKSYIQRYAEVLARLDMPVDVDFRSIYDKPVEPPVALRHPAIGIAPFARYDNKTYPISQMQQVIRMLGDQGYNVYLFGGGKKEIEVIDGWCSEFQHCTSLAGKFGIDQEIAAMASMDVMLTMDSANQHLASLTGVPVVSIWGSTTPICGFLSYGQPHDNALCSGVSCQPCTTAGSPSCRLGTLECMRKLAPATIVSKINQIVKNTEEVPC